MFHSVNQGLDSEISCSMQPDLYLLSQQIWRRVARSRLTLSHTTNFRLIQTERVCRRQFHIWRKWQKVIQTDRKHCGKRRNCSLWAISPFPSVFKRFVSQELQKVSFCGNGLRVFTKQTLLLRPWERGPSKVLWGKKVKMSVISIFFFSQNVFYSLKDKFHPSSHL